MPEIEPRQQAFTGVNAQASPDKISEDEVQSAENVDFSLIPGAARVRRASTQLTDLGTSEVDALFRHYSDQNVSGSPYYAFSGGSIFRLDSLSDGTGLAIASSASTDENSVHNFTSYKDNVYLYTGSVFVRDDGTSTSSWIKPKPATAPVPIVIELSPLTVVSTFTTAEGTSGSVGNTGVGTGTGDVNEASLRLEFKQAPTQANLNLNGIETIGDKGVHYFSIQVDEPKFVTRISIDYSIGDATFANYMHRELDVEDIHAAIDDIDVLLDAAVNKNSDDNINANVDDIAVAKSRSRIQFRPTSMRVSAAAGTFNVIAIPVTKFEQVGQDPEEGFTNIVSCRIVVEAWGPLNVLVKNWVIKGAENFPLYDPNIGYAYWETFAAVANDIVVAEGTPSSPSIRVKVNGGAMQIVGASSPAGDHGLTHRIIYRQGGYLRDAYAISTHALATATITDTLPDVDALLRNNVMLRDIRETLSGFDTRIISEPYNGRIFISKTTPNELWWSLPDRPETFPKSSRTPLSHSGDRNMGLHVWGQSLVIINRDSVYEMRGSIFEGPDQDWVLQRSGSQHGNRAWRCSIPTPHGIFMVNDEGFYFYIPGQGIDTPIQWVMDKVGDIFKGADALSPATQKGNRINGLNQAAFSACCAAWQDDRLWFAYPSGTNTRADKVMVMDFKAQKVYPYSYPFQIRSMIADKERAILAGTTNGSVMRLNLGGKDATDAGGTSNVVWHVKTKRWTAPSDTVMENVFVEYENGGNAEVVVIYDATDTQTLGTLTNTTHDWLHPKLSGTFANSAEFLITGTNTSTGDTQCVIYNLQWSALPEPKRINYWRTEHDLNKWDGDKIWDVHYADLEGIGTGTIFGEVFIDNVSVMTATIISPTSGRTISQTAFPVDTIGEVAYTVYTVNDDAVVELKHWKTRHQARNEPPSINSFKTDIQSLEEHRIPAFDVDINPNGTVTSTIFANNVAIGTASFVGTARQSFTYSLPNDVDESFGRTFHVIHNGAGFKHYKTWYHLIREPDRWLNEHWEGPSWPSARTPKTLISEVNPLAGTTTAVTYLDNVAISTVSFTGNRRQTFNTPLDLDGSNNIQSGTKVYVDYSATTVFKRYNTGIESEPKPFGKTTWAITYRKITGASRVDLGIAFGLDVEPESGTATVTSIWDIDGGAATQTNTLTYTGREWKENIPFQGGMRGFQWSQRIISDVPIHVWQSHLDLQIEGRKGVSMTGVRGNPSGDISVDGGAGPNPGGGGDSHGT